MATHLTHWGAFSASSDGRSLTRVEPWRDDPDPSPMLANVASSQHHRTRVRRPAVRRDWLHSRNRTGRGAGPFVEISWDEALELVAGELDRVYREYGPEAVYGGSYGWASAGRFHHAQSQIHRFLNVLGGYVRSVGDYSHGVSTTLLPYILGDPVDLMGRATAWSVVAEHTELFLAFGGLSVKNSVVGPGGIARHGNRNAVAAARARGCRFVAVTPLRDDTFPEAEAEWLAIRPGTDTALMLGLAHVLDDEGLADRDFLARYCVGYDEFVQYLRGVTDGIPKDPRWAAAITGIEASAITGLARELARRRTLVNVTWSLQRAQFGEQPVWMGVVLAAMLGQIGLPGGGFAHAYGSAADIGLPNRIASAPRFPQGRNPIDTFIPVARISDMLLRPGSEFCFDGGRYRYPDARLVYWCGGNPFHHHQNLARLRQAFAAPESIIVHESFWTATARHADIVLPATMTIERDDYGAGKNDPLFFPMPALTAPVGLARDDYAIFADLAERLGCRERFTEGRTAMEWLRHLYDDWRDRLAGHGHPLPAFDAFWNSEHIEIPVPEPQQVMLAEFRSDPEAFPLPTPTGRIEIFSATIDGFGYDDCGGHPEWKEPEDWSDTSREFPLLLIANQPRTRLHSQLDVGEYSRQSKVAGREPARLHPGDAAARGISDGDLILIRSERGSCLAGAVLSAAVAPGIAQLSTGAWYDPDPADPSFCRHGNPNVLISDRPSSTLTQATTGQHVRVEIAKYEGPVPQSVVDAPPRFVERAEQLPER